MIGPAATGEDIAAVKAQVRANPRGWMAQRPVALSTSPVLIGEKLSPRHIDLRPFAVNDGNDVWVLPGGLTRVALPRGRAQGQLQPGRRVQGHLGARRHGPSGGKPEEPQPSPRPPRTAPASGPELAVVSRQSGPRAVNSELLSRIAETLYWTGRYVERADDTARLIDVYVHRMLGENGADSDAACRALFGILGVPVEDPDEQLDVDTVLFRLVFEAQTQSAIAGAMLARGPARAASARSSRARCGSASTSPRTACPARNAPPSASARTSTSATSGNGRRCSSAWPTRP